MYNVVDIRDYNIQELENFGNSSLSCHDSSHLNSPHLSPCHLTDLLLFLKMQESEQVSDAGVGGNVRLPALSPVSQIGLDGHDGQLILIHGLKNVGNNEKLSQ